MQIHEIKLKNFRLFADFTCKFDPRLTVLVAENGGGKSAILDGICIAFGPYLAQFQPDQVRPIFKSDVRTHITNRFLGKIQKHYPTLIATQAAITGLYVDFFGPLIWSLRVEDDLIELKPDDTGSLEAAVKDLKPPPDP